MDELIAQIFTEARRKSLEGKHHVMVDYHGHVDMLDVSAYVPGNNYTKRSMESECVFLGWQENIPERLHAVLDKIKALN